MAPRDFPFTVFVGAEASDPDGCVTLFGAVGVTGVSITGESVYEKRQAATVSWEETDETIHSLEICTAVDFGRRQVSLDAADLRFKNQTCELTDVAFSQVQLEFPELLFERNAKDVPVVLAFSSRIAMEVVAGECPVLLLPRFGSESLRLRKPKHKRVELEDLDPNADEDDVDEASWSRYKWPVPLHVLRVAKDLRSVDALGSVLFHAACITSSPEEAYLSTEQMESVPGKSTILAWQVKMDMIEMIWQREQLSTYEGRVDRHLCADQSPQHGWQFLCGRQQVIRTSAASLVSGDGVFEFSSTRLPCTIMSHGHGAIWGHCTSHVVGPHIDLWAFYRFVP